MVLEEIKQATRESHERLESSDILSVLTSGNLSDESYRRILLKFYGYFRPLEFRVLASGIENHVPDLRERQRAYLIFSDLKLLNYKGDPDFAMDLPAVTNIDQAFGVLYVLEGSTLGGQVITRNLKKNLGEESPSTFFHGYGDQTAAKWTGFKNCLETWCQNGGKKDKVIESARTTFSLLEKWVKND